MDVVSKMLAFENGEMSVGEAIAFFQDLVDADIAWSLQGFYGRIADELIRAGLIKRPA